MTAQRQSKNNNKIINYPTQYIYPRSTILGGRKSSGGKKNMGSESILTLPPITLGDEIVGGTIEASERNQMIFTSELAILKHRNDRRMKSRNGGNIKDIEFRKFAQLEKNPT